MTPKELKQLGFAKKCYYEQLTDETVYYYTKEFEHINLTIESNEDIFTISKTDTGNVIRHLGHVSFKHLKMLCNELEKQDQALKTAQRAVADIVNNFRH